MRFVLPISLILGVGIVASACSNRYCDDCYPYGRVVSETYVHRYGVNVPKTEWTTRGRSGQVVSTLNTGVVVTKNYLDGTLEGETTYTFPHSKAIEKIETYSQGSLIKERENHPSGVPQRETEFLLPNSRVITVWYEDGTPHLRETYENERITVAEYYTTQNQIESRIDNGEGYRINRDEFGQILSTDNFEQGQIVQRTVCYPNEAPKEVLSYRNGKVHGQKKTFLPCGEPNTIEEWVNDKQEGVTIVFQNGEKAAEIPYVSGEKNGIEQRYRDGQYLVEEISWKNGKRHGPCCAYIGEDKHVSWYYQGGEVTKAQYDRLTHPVRR